MAELKTGYPNIQLYSEYQGELLHTQEVLSRIEEPKSVKTSGLLLFVAYCLALERRQGYDACRSLFSNLGSWLLHSIRFLVQSVGVKIAANLAVFVFQTTPHELDERKSCMPLYPQQWAPFRATDRRKPLQL
jgi:hypothetical protein